MDLAALKTLRGLTHLEVHCDGDTVGHESLAELPALQHFILRSSGEVTVPEFSRPDNLRLVEFASPLSWTAALHLQGFDRIGRLTNLENLTVRGCSLERKPGEGQDLKALASLQKLRILDLSDSSPVDLSPLRELAQLQVLYLRDYGLHPDYPALEQLADLGQLIELDLSQSRAGVHRAFDLTPLVRLKRLQRIELDLAEVEGGSLPSWPALRNASLPRNITDQGLEDFVREHPQLVRLRARGGGSTFHEPLKADLSPIRKLTNLTELELECDDLSLMGGMRLLTKLVIWPKLKSWGGVLNLDTAPAQNLRSLRGLEVAGMYRTLRLPSWQSVFEVSMFVPDGRSAEVIGLPWGRGILMAPNLRPTEVPNAAGSGPSAERTNRSP